MFSLFIGVRVERKEKKSKVKKRRLSFKPDDIIPYFLFKAHSVVPHEALTPPQTIEKEML